MADQNEALPPSAALLAPRAIGRRKKVKPVRPVCRVKGRFAHCPGTPVPNRAHRRVCRVGEPLTCPAGSERVENKNMRGSHVSCLSVPPPGSKRPARFVEAICPSKKSGARLVRGKEPPPGIFSPAVVKEIAVEAKKTRERGPKVLDWSECGCAPGLLERRLPSGAVRCQDPTTKKFQKADCREAAYRKPEPKPAPKPARARRKSP